MNLDVVIVGGRCAGAPLATMLAREGLRVALFEQVTFPRDTLSSHTIQGDGLAFLDRLGLTDQVRATGAPYLMRVDCRMEGFQFTARYPQRPGDVGGAASVRRIVLDALLIKAAEESGAEVHLGHHVEGLLRDADDRVVGVRVRDGDRTRDVRARLVVGADGRRSTVARLAGARAYNVLPGERSYYWTYFDGVDTAAHESFVFHRWGDRFVLGAPTDSGLYLVGVSPETGERDAFRRDLHSSVMDHALSCAPVAAALQGATRADKVYGIRDFVGYFRQAAGPGWVLVGDAGHFKDPAAGRGIGDAFRQVDTLVPALLGAWGGDLDPALARWGRWRDAGHLEHFWMGADLGCAGPISPLVPELLRGLQAEGRIDLFLDLLNHQSRMSQVLTVPRALGAVTRLLRRGGDRRAVLREAGRLMGTQVRRQWRQLRPARAGMPDPTPGPPARALVH